MAQLLQSDKKSVGPESRNPSFVMRKARTLQSSQMRGKADLAFAVDVAKFCISHHTEPDFNARLQGQITD